MKRCADHLAPDLDIDLGAEEPNAEEMDGSDDEGDERGQPDSPIRGGGRRAAGEGEAMSEAMMGEAGEDDGGRWPKPDDQLGETMPMTGSEEPGDPGTPWRPENDLSNLPKRTYL